MSDYQRIVDELRASLYSHSAETVDQLRADAADYMVACQAINDRLRQCGMLLQRGLRSEAINLCEMEPNLMDTVATLDFPEREEWRQTVARYGVVSPAPLMLDVAADLNEAYALEQPLQTLLQRHRLLALARSPLKLRLQTLRELAEADPDNVVWREDQHAFERERQKELQVEVGAAIKAGDLGRVATLDDELRHDGWLELPPPSLLNWSAGARLELLHRHVHQRLEYLERQLNEAYADSDVERARQLRREWDGQALICDLPRDHPLAAAAWPVFEWLDSVERYAQLQAEHEAAEGALERALDDGRTVPELQSAYRGLKTSGLEIQPLLQHRYEKHLAVLTASLATAARRRKQMIFGSVAAAVLAVLAIVGRWVVASQHRSAVDSHIAALRELVDGKQLDEAQKYVENLKKQAPGIAADGGVQELDRRLQAAVKKETQRAGDFAGWFDIASLRGPDRPDREALAEARKLAQLPAERAKLDEFERRVKDAAEKLQQEIAKAIQKQLEVFRGRLETLEKLDFVDMLAASAALARFNGDLRDWQERAGLGEQTRSLQDRSKNLAARIRALQDEETEEAKLAGWTGQPAEFRQALLQFAQHHPDSKRGRQFRGVAGESPLWEAMPAWNELVRSLNATPLLEQNPGAAAGTLLVAKGVLEKHGDFPDAEGVRFRLPYLQAIANRDVAKLDEGLRGLLKHKLVAGLWMVQKKADALRYYTGAPVLWAPGVANKVKYFSDIKNLDEQKFIPSTPGDVLAFNGRAPQTILADQLQKLLPATNADWEPRLFKMVKTIREDSDTDPLLKMLLLQQTLEIGSSGSLAFQHGFASQLAAIKASNVDLAADWLNPNNPAGIQQRPLAQKALDGLPDPNLAMALKTIREELERLKPSIGARYRWIGWLRCDRQGEWRCATNQQLTDDGELFVVRRSTGGKVYIDQIGNVRQNLDRIRGTVDSLVEGRPVWFKAASP